MSKSSVIADSGCRVNIIEDIASLKDDWRALTARIGSGMAYGGASMSWEWHKCLSGYKLRDANTTCLVAYDGEHCIGILPLVISKGSLPGSPWTTLAHWQDTVLTRPGLIMVEKAHGVLRNLLGHMDDIANWGVFSVTVIGGSSDEHELQNVCADMDYPIMKILEETTGSFDISRLDIDENGIPGALGKKLRGNLRRSRRTLEEQSSIEIEFYSHSDNIDSFMQGLLHVEKASWKYDAGTSIPQSKEQLYLYREYARRTAAEDYFLGTIMKHKDVPVAYDYGVIFNGIYECLKTSYVKDYARYSPTHLMRCRLASHLLESGIIWHDFIGVMDQGKAQWKCEPYCRSTYHVYNNNWQGKMAFLKQSAKKSIRNNYRRIRSLVK